MSNSRTPLSLNRPQPRPASADDLKKLQAWTEEPLRNAQESAEVTTLSAPIEQPPEEPPKPKAVRRAAASDSYVLPWAEESGEKQYSIVIPRRLHSKLKHLGTLSVDDSMRQFAIRALEKAADEEIERRAAAGTLPFPRR